MDKGLVDTHCRRGLVDGALARTALRATRGRTHAEHGPHADKIHWPTLNTGHTWTRHIAGGYWGGRRDEITAGPGSKRKRRIDVMCQRA